MPRLPYPMTTPPVIAVTRTLPGTLTIPGAEIRVQGDALPSRPQLLDFINGAAAIISMYTDRIDDEALDAAGPSLKVVSNFAVGFDNIDVPACHARNITVTNTPDAVTEGTADLAWLLIMAVARRLIEADRYARSSAYPADGQLGMDRFLGADLTGKTLLIVGAGRIGRAVALRSLAWGMNVLYVARSDHLDFELAREFGISTRAIRFYESKGLLSPERVGATRIFRKRDRARLILILRGKRLGFTLRDISDYLSLYDADRTQQVNLLAEKVDERLALLERQRNDLETTIRELREIKRLAQDRLQKAG